MLILQSCSQLLVSRLAVSRLHPARLSSRCQQQHLKQAYRVQRPLPNRHSHTVQAFAAEAGGSNADAEPANSGRTGVFTALRGIKAENSLVLALFLKFLLLSSSSVTAAHLTRVGYGHTVGALQGMSLLPVAVGLLLLTRYILQRSLHLRKGFAWALFLGGVVLLTISHRYSAMQKKYAVPPSVPVAMQTTQAAQPHDQKANRPALKTGADADQAFQAHFGDSKMKDWEQRG